MFSLANYSAASTEHDGLRWRLSACRLVRVCNDPLLFVHSKLLTSEYSELCPLPGKPAHGTVFALVDSAQLCWRGGNLCLDTDLSLVTLKLKERIVGYLESRYRKIGTNDAISWRGIWIESGANEDEFRKALTAAAETEIVFADPDHIKLRSNSRLKDHFLPTNIVCSSTPSSEQLYGRVVTLVRLFLQFGRKQPVSS